MAIPFLNNINLSDNQLLNAKLQITGTSPASEQGQIYFNSATGFLKPRVHDGSAWLNLLDTTSIINGTYITSTVTNNVDLTLDLSAVNGTATAATRFLSKDNTWAVPVDYGNWIASDNVTTETVTTGETVKWVGAGTTGVVLTGGVFTITSNDEFVGTVTSVAATHAGDAFTASIGNVATVNPSVNITMNGASTDYIDGEGNLTAFPAIPQGDITAVLQGTYINIDNSTGPEPTVNHDLTTRTDTTSTTSPGYGVSFTAVDSVTTNSTGHITALNVKTVAMPAAEAYTFNVTGDSGTDQTIDSGNTLDIAGGTNISTVVGATDTVTVNLNDSISLLGSLTVGTTGDFTGQVTIPQVPVSDTDAASKHYVDQAVTGALSYQGAYDAATNTPDLDSSPSSAIKTGWTYTVTVEGLFFTEQVRVGDVLIANNNAPTTLAEWTTVQNNIDLADATTVGIGNVVPGSSNTITAPYTSGTATLDVVDSTAAQKGAVIVSGGTGVDVAYASGTATVSLTATATRSGSIAVPTSTTYTYPNSITSTGGTNSVLIQLVDSTGETVYADVTRLTTTTFSVDYGVAEPTGVIALIQLIG